MRRSLYAEGSIFFLVLFLLLPGRPLSASADTIPIGLLSFDPFQEGINTFSIGNFTADPAGGGSALPPDFPVLTSLVFNNSHLVLVSDNRPTQNVSLGGIGPGPYADLSGRLQFPDTDLFRSATFTATLSDSHLLLSNGTTINVFPQISAVLSHPGSSTGSGLVPGDVAFIEVSPVPLPAGWVLMGSALAGVLGLSLKKRSIRKRPLRC